MAKKSKSENKKTFPRVKRRCYLVENLKQVKFCRKCKEFLDKDAGFGRRCPHCNLYYVGKKTYNRYIEDYILQNPEFLKKGSNSSYMSSTASEHVNNSISDTLSVTAHDFVLRSYVFKCSNKEHRLQDIKAVFTIIDRQGNVSKLAVPAGYCQNCNTYYVMDSVFRQIEDVGIPICRTSDIMKGGNSLSNDSNNSAYRRMATESILKKFGYSVSKEKGLPEDRRRNILAAIIDYEVLSISEINSYMSFYINSKKSQRNSDGTLRYGSAIEKWDSDRKWLDSYKTGSFKEIQARRIIIGNTNKKQE